MDNTFITITNCGTWIFMLVSGFVLKAYLPKYFEEKAKNLATKEDMRYITNEVESVKGKYAIQLESAKVEYAKQLESVKSEYARQIELFKNEIALLDKRRELSAQVIDLINQYKEIPLNRETSKYSIDHLRKFEQAYYKLIPWIPGDILSALNALFSTSVPVDEKPDIKDVIISVRKAILKKDSGDFEGKDIVNFVDFGGSAAN